jgi:L-alanine-DL-glutamate epimerase-like enolase superfamily enzyme
MRHREFVLVRIDAENGERGFAYCLSREGPVREIVARSIAPVYEGADASTPSASFYTALWTNHAVHAAGIGMRALSVVDIAAWDLAARIASQSIINYLGGTARALPVTAIVGYPPSMSAADVAEQVSGLLAQGWRRFKVPISPSVDASVERLEAARSAAPDAWIGFDVNMVFRSTEQVLNFEKRIRGLRLGWIEDVLPPGDAGAVASVRQGSYTPIAVGDEQGGSYYPEALLTAGAVDVLRIDATTDGGVTRLPEVIAAAQARGVPVAPHMFPHVHSRLCAAWGIDAPVEWGIPGTGVHPMDDGLEQPIVSGGLMRSLADDPGFGTLVNLEWIEKQSYEDPDGVLDDL